MSVLKFQAFGGEVPRLTKRGLPDNNAQVAENLLADTMEFQALPTDFNNNTTIAQLGVNEVCRTLYRYPVNSNTPNGTPLQVSTVRSSVAGDEFGRMYLALLGSDAAEYPASVLRGADLTVDANLADLGVPQPGLAPAVAIGSPSASVLTPSEMRVGEQSLMQQIRTICSGMFEENWWNPGFDLSTRPGFRATADTATWQRVYGVQATGAGTSIIPGTWVTFNGTAVARHVWLTAAPNAPAIDYSAWQLPFMTGSGSANRAIYGNIQAKVRYFSMKSDVSSYRAQLLALTLTGTTELLMTTTDADLLIAKLAAIFPADPTTSVAAEVKNNLATFRQQYDALISYLADGFDEAVAPAAGFALVSQAQATSQGAADAVATYYDSVITAGFDAALVKYFDETRFSNKFADGETPLVETRVYVTTYVNQWGEESAPSPASEVVEPNQYEPVVVTKPAETPAAGWFVAKWRVYRSASSSSLASFQYVGELPISTATYTDAKRTEALGEAVPTADYATGELWTPPPMHGTKNLRHLVGLPGGFMAGFIENTVYFSVPYYAHAWPTVYAQVCEGDVLALGVFGNTLVVLTAHGPEYVSGDAPLNMSKVKLESNEVCQSPRSVVPVAGGVLFASQNGLCLASQGGVQNLTKSLWTKPEWLSLQPENFICEEYNGVVYMSHTGGLITAALHIPTMKLVRMDLSVTAFFSDFRTGELFAALPPVTGQVAKVIKLMAGSGTRTGRWRSKRVVLEKETGFAWLRAEGTQSASLPLNVKVWGYLVVDGVEVETLLDSATASAGFTAVLTDTNPLRLGTGRYKDFEVEISGQCRVTSVGLFSSTAELQGVA